jgi:murein DD-endopeptidase MepM/ murein hydrolase activator NlpD
MKIPPWIAVISVFGILPLLSSVPSAAASDQPRWGLPLPGVSPREIISAFDPPTTPFGPGHRGVDFPASQGQRVTAVGSGIVSFAGSIAGKPVISIQLSRSVAGSVSPVRTTYEPVTPLVKTGDFIFVGMVIGHVDFSSSNAGHCRGTCLHLGLKVMEEPTPRYLNPAILWRSTALLQPNLVANRSLIVGEQFQKSSEVSPR